MSEVTKTMHAAVTDALIILEEGKTIDLRSLEAYARAQIRLIEYYENVLAEVSKQTITLDRIADAVERLAVAAENK